jgi:hypothetical protein
MCHVLDVLVGVLVDRVDRSNYEFVADIYECSRATCTGGYLTNSSGTESCWHAKW